MRKTERSPRVEMLTREGCHLCVEAGKVLDEVLGRRGIEWNEVDISADPDLLARYGREIPVVLVNGVKRFKGRIYAARLVRLISMAERLRHRS